VSFAGLVLSKYPSAAGVGMQGAKDVFGHCLHNLKVRNPFEQAPFWLTLVPMHW
jgi:hypothetical protein